ncbi:hypothetical protein A0H81_06851 [Grifola frondosa]|uniref:Uncharacterized protein n=1 Tax=Grifola frondosa TaxID=5627 RepID=A0A1C7M8T6_GRIFR|nr:hypothetical protein A0H81_06851 [Grifola frondosa]
MVPTRLAQSIPSLRCVALARGYQCWSTELPGRQTKATYSWFHVSGSGEQRSAEPIKSWEGERVHDYMCRAEFDSIESGLDELFPSG